MILRGSCSDCGAVLAADQRYCIACGKRLGEGITAYIAPHPAEPARPFEVKPSAGSRLVPPVPPQVATTLASGAIAFGFVIGIAISPGAEELLAGTPPPAAQAPTTSAPGPAAPATQSEPTPPPAGTTEVASSRSSGVLGSSQGSTGGGGGGKKKKRKQQQGQILTGTVIHTNPNAASYVLANGTSLAAIHSANLPVPGSQISVPVRTLFNGTYAEDGTPKPKTTGKKRKKKKKVPPATQASFSGIVTYSDPYIPGYTVSSRGVSVLIRQPAGATLPVPGSFVSVTVQIGGPGVAGANPDSQARPAPPQPAPAQCDTDPGSLPVTPIQPASVLTQVSLNVNQTGLKAGELEGIVQQVCPETRELVISADDIRESLRDVVLKVPDSTAVDFGKLAPGISITTRVGFGDAGTLSVMGLSSDYGATGADDAAAAQGSV